MTTHQNIGKSCLQTIASIWQVDTAATKWVDGGFDWTPGSHLVRVRALSNGKAGAEERCQFSVETDFLTSVPIEEPKFTDMIAAYARIFPSTYSMQYPPAEIWKEHAAGEKPKLSLFSSMYMSPEMVPSLTTFFAGEAIVGVVNAEIQSAFFSENAGGEPDYLPSGKKIKLDQILEVLNDVYAPEGKKPNRWAGTEEFVKFAEQYGRSDTCFGTGDENGLTLETALGDDSALIRLWTNQQHEQLGNGLLVTVQSPFTGRKEDVIKQSALLNYLEAHRWTDFPQLGCWNPQEIVTGKFGLAHTSFVPNVLYRAGLATNFALWSMARVRWLRQELWPDLKNTPMLEILEKRLAGQTEKTKSGPIRKAKQTKKEASHRTAPKSPGTSR